MVVDNASRDGTPELIDAEFPEVELIANSRNLGFAAANNLAIRRGSAPYVLALNPDTRLSEGALDRLLSVLDEHPEVGICGCRLVRDDGSFDHAARRSFPTIMGALGHFLGVGRLQRAPRPLSQYRAPDVEAGPVDAVNGAFMLMRRSALDEVGLFDEGYWMYMEDLDLCYRFREAGWLTWYEPTVSVAHVKAGSSGPVRSPRLNYAFHYGMYRFYSKHYAPRSNPLLNALVYAGIFGKLIASTSRNALRTRRVARDPSPWSARLRVVRALARTRAGYRLKRALPRRRRLARSKPDTRPPAVARRQPARLIRNVLLVSHGNFTTNSGRHVHAIASELANRGYNPAIAVPGRSFGLRDVGVTNFPVLSHRDAAASRTLSFIPDLVHAFTPRADVRRVTFAVSRAAGCPYVVHLEDDDARIDGGTPASERDAFVAGSTGITVVVARLLEFKPAELPGAVVWPGFDEAILSVGRSAAEVRSEVRIDPAALMLVYNGNVHETNLAPIGELYRAVELLRRDGMPAVLVKTGWNFVPDVLLPRLGDGIRDLGWVARDRVPELLHAADVLIQPGSPRGFDEYRFPSKLPEFFASGRPVVLPRTNVGLHVRDGEQALLLDRGDAAEIAEKVALLAGDAERASAIGEEGRAFALERLRWSANVESVIELYAAVSASTI